MIITKKFLVLILLQGLLPELLGQRWEFPSQITGLIGSCVEIPCTFHPARNSRTSSTVWYLYDSSYYLEIFNSQESSEVLIRYRDRTSLVRGSSSCSLRIDPVSANDGKDYYPGITEDEDTNAYSLHRRYIRLHVTDTPNIPKLAGSRTMIEGRPEVVECSVEHTCGSSPPSLSWNKPGRTERSTENISGGLWKEILRLTYNPSYKDDKTQIQCTATYHNNRRSHNAAKLDIRYAPKDVTVNLPKNTALVEGRDVILTCTSISNPPAHRYEWYLTDSRIKSAIQDQAIRILNVTRGTEPISCVAISDFGRGVSPPTKIPVQHAATGVQVIVLSIEEATELKCDFVSSNPNVTHYTWIKNGIKLANKTGQILVLDSNEDESGSYSCIAHNTAGSSNSTELEFRDSRAEDEDSGNLLLILGILAGIIILLFLMIIVYFCIRRKRKPASESSPVHGEIRSNFPNLRNRDETSVQEHEYGNIQVKPKPPRSQQPGYSSHASRNQSYAIYSNEEFMQVEADIEYSTIAHTGKVKRQDLFDDDENEVNYSAVRNSRR